MNTGACSRSELGDVPARLAPLFAAAECRSPFLGLDWYRLLAATTESPVAPARARVMAADDASGRPAAALVLRAGESPARRGPARRLRSFSNFYTSLYMPAVAPGSPGEAGLGALAREIANERPRWDTVDLEPMDPDDPAYGILQRALEASGFTVKPYFRFANWRRPCRDLSYEGYLDGLPGPLRSTIARRGRRLERERGVELRVHAGGDDLDTGLAGYLSVYARSWKRPEPHDGFIPGLVRLAADRGWLRLGVLRLDGEPAAAQLWLVHNDVASIFKLAHVRGTERFSLGTVLTARMMRHVLDVDRVHEVDFLTGDDAYKRSWMSVRTERWGLLAMNRATAMGRLTALRERGLDVARRLLPRRRAASPAAP